MINGLDIAENVCLGAMAILLLSIMIGSVRMHFVFRQWQREDRERWAKEQGK
jgi:hypothetical protein